MKYFVIIFGIISILFVSVINFYPDEIKDFIETKILHEEYILAKPNDYYLIDSFEYFSNYTDDVSNKEELLNYIYYVINTGSTYADGECTKDYITCISDLNEIASNNDLLSLINNFVHPYNSYKTMTVTSSDDGKFSLAIEHIYSDNEIAEINYVVNDIIKNNINDDMTAEEKINIIHEYIINNTSYDKLKADNINDTTYKSNTAYGVLIQGYGICSGYSDATAILLNNIGITNYKISNETHIWNLVRINGIWAHLDTTWDDPISEFNTNRDTYFLISYEKLQELNDGTHSFDKNIYLEAY